MLTPTETRFPSLIHSDLEHSEKTKTCRGCRKPSFGSGKKSGEARVTSCSLLIILLRMRAGLKHTAKTQGNRRTCAFHLEPMLCGTNSTRMAQRLRSVLIMTAEKLG